MVDLQAISVGVLLVAAAAAPLVVRRAKSDTTDATSKSDTESPVTEQPKATEVDLIGFSKDSISAGTQSLKDIRRDLGTYGTAIGVASSGLVAVATWSTFDKLLPIPRSTGGWWTFALAILFAVSAIVCSGVLTSLFFRVRRRILIDTQYWRGLTNSSVHALMNNNLSGTEFELISRKLQEVIDDELGSEPARSLQDLEGEIVQFRRCAAQRRRDGAAADEVARAAYETVRLQTRLVEGLVNGAILVLESRSSKLYRGWLAPSLAVVAAISVAALFFISSWSGGVPERVASWTSCVKEIPPDAQKEACKELDPRGRNAAYPVTSPTPAPTVTVATPSPGPTVTVTPRPAPSNAVKRLNDCAKQNSRRSVPTSLRNRALARCAGV